LFRSKLIVFDDLENGRDMVIFTCLKYTCFSFEVRCMIPPGDLM